MSEVLAERWIETPIGRVLVVASAVGVRKVWFDRDVRGKLTKGRAGESGAERGQEEGEDHGLEGRATAMVERAAGELGAYFAGTLRAFTVPVDWAGLGGTAFQRAVWERLVRIPLGERVTYGQIAKELPAELGGGVGGGGAARAVGLANHDNPVAIIVPCHRVIGADGTLTGYAGGLEAKRKLLEHEAMVAGTTLWSAG